MTSLLMNPCGDIDITAGRVTIVRSGDAVKQRWLVYIRTFLGEWFLDQNIGVPFVQRIFKKQVSRTEIKEVFAAASLEVPGILQVPSVVIDSLDVATRELEVTVNCIIDSAEGPVLEVFRYTGSLPAAGCPTDITHTHNNMLDGEDELFEDDDPMIEG